MRDMGLRRRRRRLSPEKLQRALGFDHQSHWRLQLRKARWSQWRLQRSMMQVADQRLE